ncbi:MAG TPA: NUDIX domain-containing protein [Puia sp.]|nr:NUDIX domain-containing protein [Puia sp.]
MKNNKSAGLLPYRIRGSFIEFFLVHPGGPFWKNKDNGAWSIPKGEFTEEEPLIAAQREFLEETGLEAKEKFIPLTPVKQKSGKLIFAFGVEMEIDPSFIRSNQFEIEWPPHSKKMQAFPEVDKAGWFQLEEAKLKVNPAQFGLIKELLSKLQLD